MPRRYTELPWFKLDPRTVVTDSRLMFLPPAVLGCLLRVWCYQWLQGPLPDDDDKLAQLTGAGEQWSELRESVLSLLVQNEHGQWLDEGLELLRVETLKSSKRLSEAGKKGASKRWSKSEDTTIDLGDKFRQLAQKKRVE